MEPLSRKDSQRDVAPERTDCATQGKHKWRHGLRGSFDARCDSWLAQCETQRLLSPLATSHCSRCGSGRNQCHAGHRAAVIRWNGAKGRKPQREDSGARHETRRREQRQVHMGRETPEAQHPMWRAGRTQSDSYAARCCPWFPPPNRPPRSPHWRPEDLCANCCACGAIPHRARYVGTSAT